MKRTELKAGRKSVERGSTFKAPRAAMQRKGAPKRSQPRRYWKDARGKVEDEGRCRLYRHDLGCAGPLEAAHVIGREHDPHMGLVPGVGGYDLYVRPVSVVPLCRVHHDRYDGRSQPWIDLLPALTLDEQLAAVEDVGGIELARRRLCPTAYRVERSAA